MLSSTHTPIRDRVFAAHRRLHRAKQSLNVKRKERERNPDLLYILRVLEINGKKRRKKPQMGSTNEMEMSHTRNRRNERE
jgi:hypothetical protein